MSPGSSTRSERIPSLVVRINAWHPLLFSSCPPKRGPSACLGLNRGRPAPRLRPWIPAFERVKKYKILILPGERAPAPAWGPPEIGSAERTRNPSPPDRRHIENTGALRFRARPFGPPRNDATRQNQFVHTLFRASDEEESAATMGLARTTGLVAPGSNQLNLWRYRAFPCAGHGTRTPAAQARLGQAE